MKPEAFIKMMKENPNRAMAYMYLKKRPIKQWILKNSGSAAQAKDVLQEGLVLLYQNLCIRGKVLNSSPQMYWMGICKNLWYAELRRLKPLDKLPEIDTHIGLEEGDQLQDINVMGLLNEMGEQCKNLLKLFYFSGKNMNQIAQIMDFKSAEVAKSIKYKCIQKAKLIAYSNLKKEVENGTMG